ncbi:MAG: alpha-1,2-fucosyltransferase [Sphingobacteriaceae bacterium]|nr:MAG: alpha-1,2-fucosyltransferase [Sphingobacteriaceae bacterium]
MAIVVKIQGGLGNQLFQFAFGESLGSQLKQPVLYDLTSYRKPGRILGLNKFNIDLPKAPDELISGFFNLQNRLRNRLLLTSSLNKFQIHFEKQQPYYKVPANLKGNMYYAGYWQDEQYFSPFQTALKAQLTLKAELKESILRTTIKENNTVAIHFRRGDYLNPAIQNVHGLLNMDYYIQAIKLISKKIPDALFIVFSDDPSWIQSELKLPYNWLHADPNKLYTDEETLILMSLCKHQIIANSTYSWWAAWLNCNPNKLIIAPERWFNNVKSYSPILNDWITINDNGF